jgi:hypothetical protein
MITDMLNVLFRNKYFFSFLFLPVLFLKCQVALTLAATLHRLPTTQLVHHKPFLSASLTLILSLYISTHPSASEFFRQYITLKD